MSDRMRAALEYGGLACLTVAAGLAWGIGAALAFVGVVLVAEANLER